MTHPLFKLLAREADKLRQAGLYKTEDGGEAEGGVDLTGRDYLGLGRDASVRDAAIAAARELGPGTASSRAFGGTREAHRQLEGAVARLLEQPDAIIYPSGYAAAIGLFDPLFDNRDAILCDAWVHPSVADGARLSGARAIPYRQGDVEDLEDKLKRSRAARFRAVVTSGVFPFSGELAALGDICDLAERYEAIVVVDDRLGTGVLGERGRGSAELARVSRRVHLILGSFSDALGGGGGGFVAGARAVIDWLRQKSAPYLFSGALAPPLVGAAAAAVDLVARGETALATLRARIEMLRSGLVEHGYAVLGRHHPILTVAVGNTVTLQKIVNRLFGFRIRVHGLCYPVVPEHQARIRLQVCAAHSEDDIRRTVEALIGAGRLHGVL